MQAIKKFIRTLFALWIGGIVTVGLVVVPSIFSSSIDKPLAGTVASHVFTTQSWVNLGVGALILLLLFGFLPDNLLRHGLFGTINKNLRRLLMTTIFILVTTAVLAFFLQPEMLAIREGAMNAHVKLENSVNYQYFKYLHMASTAIYLLQMSLGVIVVWMNQIGNRDY